MMKRELTLSPEPATTTVELREWVQNSWDNLSQDDIQHLLRLFTCENTSLRCCQSGEVGTLCIDMTVWAPLYVMCVSFDLNLSYSPTMISYLSHQFAVQ